MIRRLLLVMLCTLVSCKHGGSIGDGSSSLSDSDEASTEEETYTRFDKSCGMSDQTIATMQNMMSGVGHRQQHYLWHAVRGSWNELTAAQRDIVLRLYPNWSPPNPAFDASGAFMCASNAGEDFLFMHREMLGHLRGALKDKMIQPWTTLPESATDLCYGFNGNSAAKSKNKYQVIAQWESRFQDPRYLKSVSLAALGMDLEFSIHNTMHMRWAQEPTPPTPDIDIFAGLTVPPSFDGTQNDYLGDPYSAHVNPIFWKLHGWVDARIDGWLIANGYVDSAGNPFISESCPAAVAPGTKCYQWKSKWVGVPNNAAPTTASRSKDSPRAPNDPKDVARVRSLFKQRSSMGFKVETDVSKLPPEADGTRNLPTSKSSGGPTTASGAMQKLLRPLPCSGG